MYIVGQLRDGLDTFGHLKKFFFTDKLTEAGILVNNQDLDPSEEFEIGLCNLSVVDSRPLVMDAAYARRIHDRAKFAALPRCSETDLIRLSAENYIMYPCSNWCVS